MLVVDCAPTAETLRLLSLPEIMNWYIERIFPVERRVVKTIRPLVSRITTLPIAGDRVFGAVERLHRNLDGRASAADQRADVERAPGGEPREDGDRRGPAHVHVPVAVRLPGGRRHREPDHPRPRSTTRTSASGRTSRPSTWRRSGSRSSRCRSSPPGCSTGRWSGSPCSPRWPTRCTASSTRPPMLHNDEPIRVREAGGGYVLSMQLPFIDARRPRRASARRGAVRARRPVQAEPDPAPDPEAAGGARRLVVDEHLEVALRTLARG